MNNRIHYGFGQDYLSNWGMKEALREIYQNFMDYGEYQESVIELGGISKVTVQNAWQPESLDFLRIGNSRKDNADAVGKHGEGLKMAFLILLREGYKSSIMTQRHEVYPGFYDDDEIGQCFCLEYSEHGLDPSNVMFGISFTCDQEEFRSFKDDLVTETDVVFDDNYWGQVVDKEKGRIYSGGLFVTKLDNIGRAYNIKPHHLPLDRDRSVPRAIDVSYAASKINEAYGKLSVQDLNHSDAMFIEKVPEEIISEFTPVVVGNSVEFKYTDANGNDQVVANNSIKNALHKDNFFTAAIKKLKNMIAKQLGLYDLLLEFQKKHVYGELARQDFEIILQKVGKEVGEAA